MASRLLCGVLACVLLLLCNMALNAGELRAESRGFESDEGFCDGDSIGGGDFGGENRRAYHGCGDSKYVLPREQGEIHHLDLQHHAFMMTTKNRLHLAPIKSNPQHVMDLGMGKGMWAIEFARQYPQCKIQGTECPPKHSSYSPASAHFDSSNAGDDLHADTKFDYIHGRMQTAPAAHPRSILQSAFHSLAPGGYLEMQDVCFPARCDDGSLSNTAFDRWNKLVLEGARRLGRPWSNPQLYKTWMQEIGFDDVMEKVFTWPVSQWSRDQDLRGLSRLIQKDFLDGLEALSLAVMMRGLSWSREQVEGFLTQVQRDVMDTDIHGYFSVYFVYGRKPDAS